MLKEKNITVRYTQGYDTVESSDSEIPSLIPRYGHVSFSTSGVKRYHNVLLTLMSVNGIARDLMDWLTSKMDNDNKVYNTRSNRQNFIDFIKSAKAKTPTHSSVNSAFAGLKNKGLLIDMGRSSFMVNPKYFINSANEESRSRLIRMVLEFENGVSTAISIKQKA